MCACARACVRADGLTKPVCVCVCVRACVRACVASISLACLVGEIVRQGDSIASPHSLYLPKLAYM